MKAVVFSLATTGVVAVATLNMMLPVWAAPVQGTQQVQAPAPEEPLPKGDPEPVPGQKPPKTVVKQGKGYARVVSVLPNTPAVDVYIDDIKTLSNIAFRTIGDYMPIPGGEHRIKVTASGKTDKLAEVNRGIIADKFYTLCVTGTEKKPELLLQNESIGKDTTDKAKVRFYHLAPDVSEINLTTPSDKEKRGYAYLLRGLEYGKELQGTFDPATLTLEVRELDEVLKELPNVKLEGGKRYAIFILGEAEGQDEFEVVVKPAGVKY